MLTVCQFCQCKIFTNIEKQTTWVGIALSILLFIIFRIYSIFLIILLIPLTQSTIHTCPNCLNKIGVRSFYDTLSLTDRVFTFQLFSFGIIITKKQLLGTFFGLFFIIVFYVFFTSIELTPKFLDDTWEQFHSLCNRGSLSNKEIATKCREKYTYQDISWKGYAIRIDFDERFFSRYRAQILTKMIPNNANEVPDVFLQFTEYNYEKYKTQIVNTTRGDLIQFNATIRNVGDEQRIPLLEVNAFKKLNEKIYIAPHVHNSGRYQVNEEMIRNIPGEISEEEKRKIKASKDSHSAH